MPPPAAASAHAPDRPPLLIVAGHHRSGTSLLAQLLAAAGLSLCDDPLPRSASSPASDALGNLADREVVQIHDRILADNGRTWQVVDDLLPVVNDDVWAEMAHLVQRRRRRGRPWGFKDPRVCLFLPLWRHLAPEARILMTFRHPASSVESIERREAHKLIEGIFPAPGSAPFWTEQDHALRLWVSHNRALLRTAEAHPDDVLVVRFDDLAAERDIIGDLNRRWDLGLTPIPPSRVLDPTVMSAAEPALAVHAPELATEVDQVWRRLRQQADRTTAAAAR